MDKRTSWIASVCTYIGSTTIIHKKEESKNGISHRKFVSVFLKLNDTPPNYRQWSHNNAAHTWAEDGGWFSIVAVLLDATELS
jgi:hypothetical protein